MNKEDKKDSGKKFFYPYQQKGADSGNGHRQNWYIIRYRQQSAAGLVFAEAVSDIFIMKIVDSSEERRKQVNKNVIDKLYDVSEEQFKTWNTKKEMFDDRDEYFAMLRKFLEDIAEYQSSIIKYTFYRKNPGYDRKGFEELDKSRMYKHNAVIDDLNILNRIAQWAVGENVFEKDELPNRHACAVAAFQLFAHVMSTH